MPKVPLIAILLAGCTVVGHERVAGWPDLAVVEHHVTHAEMRSRCGIFAPAWMNVEACAIFYFDRGECHIVVSRDFPDESALEHEHLHCRGYDHIGEKTMAKMLADWRERAGLTD